MNIDERLEKLTERHEALTQTVELGASMQRDNEQAIGRLEQSVGKLEQQVESLERSVERITQSVGGSASRLKVSNSQ